MGRSMGQVELGKLNIFVFPQRIHEDARCCICVSFSWATVKNYSFHFTLPQQFHFNLAESSSFSTATARKAAV